MEPVPLDLPHNTMMAATWKIVDIALGILGKSSMEVEEILKM